MNEKQNEEIKAIESIDRLFEYIEKHIQNSTPISEYQLALIKLANRSMNLANSAFLLLTIPNNFFDSTILLRASFEACVLLHYLEKNQVDFNKYKAYSYLVELKNMLELLDMTVDQIRDEDIQEQRTFINEKIKFIVKSGFHDLFRINASDLNNLEILKRQCSRAHFQSFKKMLDALKGIKETEGLVFIGVQAYGLGSQIAHSQYNMVYSEKHPLYEKNSAYKQVITMLVFCTQGLRKLKLLSNNFDSEFSELVKEAMNQVNSINKEAF